MMHRVAVVTGTRAEYGLLRPVLRKLAQQPDVRLDLLVTGAHLSHRFGHTVDEILADGFRITARLDILAEDSPAGEGESSAQNAVPVSAVPKAADADAEQEAAEAKRLAGRTLTARRTALALQLFGDYFAQVQNRPDVVLALGDRYEMLAAGQAAALLDIPVAHISGGDVTIGADDDWFRHCLTKLAKLHFPSCEVYRRRVIRMGEQPQMVHNVGGLGDENIRSMELLSREALAKSLGMDLSQPYALITLHPETTSAMPPRQQAAQLLQALDNFPKLRCLFTGSNADAGGEEITREIMDYCARRKRAVFFQSLGVLRYLSAMQHAAVVVGNSSSGVVETPTFGVPTVDIGHRQDGRVTGRNVLRGEMDSPIIEMLLIRALSPGFAAQARQAESPYYGGDTSGKIVDILLQALQSGALLPPKQFYDDEEENG